MGDENDLKRILVDVQKFYLESSNTEVRVPKIKLSGAVKDAAWSGKGVISINRSYNPEGLGDEELVAHEFFHHVQDEVFWKKHGKKVRKDEEKMINEFMEGSAFLFAGLYVNRGEEKQAADEAVCSYVSDNRHMTKSGIGNRLAFKAYEKSGYNTRSFIDNVLDYGFVTELISD